MDDLVVCPSRCKALEKDVQCLGELVVLEVICKDSNNKKSPVDPDKIHCTQSIWQKLL